MNLGPDTLQQVFTSTFSHCLSTAPQGRSLKAPVFRRQNYRHSWGTGPHSGSWTEAAWDLNPELSDSRAWTEEASLIPPNSVVKHFGLVVPNPIHLLLLRRQGCSSPRAGRRPEFSAKLCHSSWNTLGKAVSSSVGAQDL